MLMKVVLPEMLLEHAKHTKPLLIMALPATGTRAIHSWLEVNSGKRFYNENFDGLPWDPKAGGAVTGHMWMPSQKLPESMTRVHMVRDPLDTVYSLTMLFRGGSAAWLEYNFPQFEIEFSADGLRTFAELVVKFHTACDSDSIGYFRIEAVPGLGRSSAHAHNIDGAGRGTQQKRMHPSWDDLAKHTDVGSLLDLCERYGYLP
jgi:hypothetical protein